MTQEKDIELMFRRHYEKMYNLARYILSDDDESKDVVSEVFTQILADDVVLLPESEEGYLLTSSSCHPKFFVKEFCYFLMSCHQHCLGINLLVQR